MINTRTKEDKIYIRRVNKYRVKYCTKQKEFRTLIISACNSGEALRIIKKTDDEMHSICRIKKL